MSYLKSLASVMDTDLPQSSGYAIPATAVHQPGTATVAPAHTPTFMENGVAGMKAAAHPYAVAPTEYHDVQFVKPQLGTYQNLSHLLQGG